MGEMRDEINEWRARWQGGPFEASLVGTIHTKTGTRQSPPAKDRVLSGLRLANDTGITLFNFAGAVTWHRVERSIARLLVIA